MYISRCFLGDIKFDVSLFQDANERSTKMLKQFCRDDERVRLFVGVHVRGTRCFNLLFSSQYREMQQRSWAMINEVADIKYWFTLPK